MAQNDDILRHIRERGSITPAEAYVVYGIMRLASRIGELRERGYPIVTERAKGKRHAIYRMGGGKG